MVGGGISGLSAAHFYRKERPAARILVLDNHDDFGGHAKRNEFKIGDETRIGYGGRHGRASSSVRWVARAARMELGEVWRVELGESRRRGIVFASRIDASLESL